MALQEVVTNSVLLSTLAFLVGIGIVLGSVEKFIEYVTDAAAHLGVSAFLLTAVFAGVDWENAVLSFAAVSGEVSGMVLGSEIAVTGARGILAAFRLDGLAFGATIMSVIASLEEIFLTVEPVRQNRSEIGVGNIVGSTLFFVTVNAGVIALVGPIAIGPEVFTVHWPFLFGSLILVLAFLYRGTLTRLNGVVLLAVYVAYWGFIYLL